MFHTNKTMRSLKNGSLTESLTGFAGAVLAILGLLNIYPLSMLNIATVVVGVALLIKGSTVASKYQDLFLQSEEGVSRRTGGFGLGAAAKSLSGISGIILGILAILGLAPQIIIPTAVIVFGAGMVLGSGADFLLNSFLLLQGRSGSAQQDTLAAAVDLEILVGIAVMILGILALIDVVPLLLSLVAMLSISFAIFINGAASFGRIVSAYSG